MFGANAVHKLEERPVIMNIPQQIGQEDKECGHAAEPNPLVQEDSALFSQQQTNDNPESK